GAPRRAVGAVVDAARRRLLALARRCGARGRARGGPAGGGAVAARADGVVAGGAPGDARAALVDAARRGGRSLAGRQPLVGVDDALGALDEGKAVLRGERAQLGDRVVQEILGRRGLRGGHQAVLVGRPVAGALVVVGD